MYDWSEARLDGTETVKEIVEIVGCKPRAVYHKCRDGVYKYKEIPYGERRRGSRGPYSCNEEYRLPRAPYPTEETPDRPLEGLSRAASNFNEDM